MSVNIDCLVKLSIDAIHNAENTTLFNNKWHEFTNIVEYEGYRFMLMVA